MKSNNHLLSLAFVLSTSVWLSACGGGGGGSDSADAQLVEPEEPCTAREASEGLTGIWKIETFTKLFLQKAAGSIEDVGDLDPNKLINIGVMIFDKNETVTMTFCETDGVAELIREGNNLTTSTDVNELTGGDLFSGITVQNNDSIQLDINVPGFTELPIFFDRADLRRNDVCMSFEGMAKLPRTRISCIDEPLFSENDAGEAEVTELTMGVITGGEIYRIIMDFEGSVTQGTYDLAAGEVAVTISSPGLMAPFGTDTLTFESGTVTLTGKDSFRVKGKLDLVSTGGQKVVIDFYSRVF